MHILLAHQCILPVNLYGGTERVVWALGKELVELGCKVTYLLQEGSHCDFADVIYLDDTGRVGHLIPEDVDLIHLHYKPEDLHEIQLPYVITIHGNARENEPLEENSIFVSKDHAMRHQSESYVYNGLNWEDYTKPDFSRKRSYFHFLGKAAWRVKNVQGAIDVIKKSRIERLHILGGFRFNLKMGIRLTFTPKTTFHGMVGGQQKDSLINGSKGLVFPVRWHEPFGLAIIESMYFGCPVFGTPYGALPELVHKEVGFLSANCNELSEQILLANTYDKKKCHEYARVQFNSRKMVKGYIEKYEKVIGGEKLNQSPPALLQPEESTFLPWT